MKIIKSGTISRSQIHHKKKYKDATPRPTQKDFDKMYSDIEAKGQLRLVNIDEDWNLIDGYTRYEILGKQRIDDIKFTQYRFDSEEEKLDYINSMNVKRRHLSEYQKFLSALPNYEAEVKEAEKRQKAGTLAPQEAKGKATVKAAKEAGMSKTTFERSLLIHNRATPEQEKDVITGKKAIKTLAVQLTRKDRNLPKIPLPKTISDVFLGDVPYGYEDKGGRAAAEEHFPTMSAEEIREEFKNIAAADNAIIFFWMSPSIQFDTIPIQYNNPDIEGCAVIVDVPIYKAILDAGGFKVIGEFVWDKEKIGVGNYNRNQHENLLIAIKGDMPIPAELFPSIIKKLRSVYARKPNLWPMIKKMYPKRNYCELYAREQTPGVLCHGNEVKGGKTPV